MILHKIWTRAETSSNLLRRILVVVGMATTSEVFAAEHSQLLVQRFTSGPLDSGLSPHSPPKDCALLLLTHVQEAVHFDGIFRTTGDDPYKLARDSDAQAISHMGRKGTLSAEEQAYYRTTTEELDLDRTTYVDQLVETPDPPGTFGTIFHEGRNYRRSAVLRLVSGQEIVKAAPNASHASGYRSHSLPWMEEFPEFWASKRPRFRNKFVFELGRAAGIEPGAIRTNRMLIAWMALRETLLSVPLSEVRKSDRFLDDTFVFAHATKKKNADVLASDEYGMTSLGKPHGNDDDHEIFYISLRDMLAKFPAENHFPALAKAMEYSGTENPFEILKLYEDALGYRRKILENARGDVVDIHDRTMLGLHFLYEAGTRFHESALQMYAMGEESILRGLMAFEKMVSKEVPLPRLHMSRIWWSSKRCGTGTSVGCDFSESLVHLFQTVDWTHAKYQEFLSPEGVAYRLGPVHFLTLSWRGLPKDFLDEIGATILAQADGKTVVSIRYDKVQALRTRYPALAETARQNPLDVGVLELKKRLLFPAFIPGLAL